MTSHANQLVQHTSKDQNQLMELPRYLGMQCGNHASRLWNRRPPLICHQLIHGRHDWYLPSEGCTSHVTATEYKNPKGGCRLCKDTVRQSTKSPINQTHGCSTLEELIKGFSKKASQQARQGAWTIHALCSEEMLQD